MRRIATVVQVLVLLGQESLGLQVPRAGVSSLVSPEWLRKHVGDARLRIFDVTQTLSREENSVSAASDAFAACHIPGAEFVDVGGRFARGDAFAADGRVRLHNMLPSAEVFGAELEALGVDDATHVVLYSSAKVMWATRVWWMLSSFGFRGRISVLDGGLKAWRAAGFEVDAGPSVARQTTAAVSRRVTSRDFAPGAFVGKDTVLDAISDPSTALVDSLSAASYLGTKKSRYGRPGHIPSALSVPYTSVVDEADTGRFFDADRLRDVFASAGLGDPSTKILAY